jgi:hypothetical protein
MGKGLKQAAGVFPLARAGADGANPSMTANAGVWTSTMTATDGSWTITSGCVVRGRRIDQHRRRVG